MEDNKPDEIDVPHAKEIDALSRSTRERLVKAEDYPQPVQITTGDTDGTQTEVLSGGLKLGMEVITGQLAVGHPGMPADGQSGGIAVQVAGDPATR